MSSRIPTAFAAEETKEEIAPYDASLPTVLGTAASAPISTRNTDARIAEHLQYELDLEAAIKRSAYECGAQSIEEWQSWQTGSTTRGQVVSIETSPPRMMSRSNSTRSAHAEWMGTDPSPAASAPSSTAAAAAATVASMVDVDDDDDNSMHEAYVIESGKVGKSLQFGEYEHQAQVLLVDDAEMDRKPAARRSRPRSHDVTDSVPFPATEEMMDAALAAAMEEDYNRKMPALPRGNSLTAITEQEGEVLAVQDEADVHPAAMREHNELLGSRAELVGLDYAPGANATSSYPYRDQSEDIAVAVVEEGQEEAVAVDSTPTAAVACVHGQSSLAGLCGSPVTSVVESAENGLPIATGVAETLMDMPVATATSDETHSTPPVTSLAVRELELQGHASSGLPVDVLEPAEIEVESATTEPAQARIADFHEQSRNEGPVVAIVEEHDVHPAQHPDTNVAAAEFVAVANETADANEVDPTAQESEAVPVGVIVEDAAQDDEDDDGYPIKPPPIPVAVRETDAETPTSGSPSASANNELENTANNGEAPTTIQTADNGPVFSTPSSSHVPQTPPEAMGSSRSGSGNFSERLRRSAESNINMLAQGTSNVIDVLFGDRPPGQTISHDDDKAAIAVQPRTLLPWSVIHNTTTDMWIATIQTNQRALEENNTREASKALRAFSMPTQLQAVCLAKAWTPPRMLPFSEQKRCHMCNVKFAVFNKSKHCRNCGVCICSKCLVKWPAETLPETYNIKKETYLNVCKSCDWLCNSFRRSLLEGNHNEAVAIHATGNVNLHTPFANVKGEKFYPVHCAVLGRNLDLVKFLIDENCCPIKSVRVAGTVSGRPKYTPIITSKGRSLLGIALENDDLPLLRYLVVEKGVSLHTEPNISLDQVCRALTNMLNIVPCELLQGTLPPIEEPYSPEPSAPPPPTSPDAVGFHEERTLSTEARDLYGATQAETFGDCIMCYDEAINCAAIPCGHSCCCVTCSESLGNRCPVCSSSCTFQRLYPA